MLREIPDLLFGCQGCVARLVIIVPARLAETTLPSSSFGCTIDSRVSILLAEYRVKTRTDTSVVEDDIQTAKFLHASVYHCLDVLLLANVAHDGDSFWGFFDNLRDERDGLFSCRAIYICADDVGALAGEEDGRLEANAAVFQERWRSA